MKNILKAFVFFFIVLNTACTNKDNNINELNKKENILQKKIDTTQIEKLSKNNTIYFDLDKYNIKLNYEKIISDYADFLKKNNTYKIIIEGHTDERGTPEYNISLGERRANAVKKYLQMQGVSEKQISIISYGEEKPEALGHNENSYEKNRRAVLLHLNEK